MGFYVVYRNFVKNFCESLDVNNKSLTLHWTSEFFRVYLLSSFYIGRVPWGGNPADFFIFYLLLGGRLKNYSYIRPVFGQTAIITNIKP